MKFLAPPYRLLLMLVCTVGLFPTMQAQDNALMTAPLDDAPAIRSKTTAGQRLAQSQRVDNSSPALQLDNPPATIYVNGTLNTGTLTGSGVAAPAGEQWSENPNLPDLTQANINRGISGGITSATTWFRLADDFTVPAGQTWRIDSIAFYAYQTGSSTTVSPFLAYNLQIWLGRPEDLGSIVVFGDTTTNRLRSTVFAKMYRVLNTLVAETPPPPAPDLTRPIFRNTVSVGGLELPEGDFWLDWQSKLTTDAAHFAPPIAIPGRRSNSRYNARQRLTTFTWQDVIDAGVPAAAPDSALDFPFIIYGIGPPLAVGSGDIGIPDAFVLHQNFPNPFNPSTSIQFGLPEASNVRLTVHDLLGREVGVLLNGRRNAGVHEVTWNGLSSNGTGISSGVYVYRLEARSEGKTFVSMKKMLLMK